MSTSTPAPRKPVASCSIHNATYSFVIRMYYMTCTFCEKTATVQFKARFSCNRLFLSCFGYS